LAAIAEVEHTGTCVEEASQEGQRGDIHHNRVPFLDIAVEGVGRASYHVHNLGPVCYDLTMGDGWQQEGQNTLLLQEDHD
jgi:hypothetical protein